MERVFTELHDAYANLASGQKKLHGMSGKH